MNLLELKNIVDEMVRRQENKHQDLEQISVCIPIKNPTAIGGTPTVDVKSIQAGFDGDNGKIMIYPSEDLSKTDHDYLAKIRKEAEELGWSVYKYRAAKREIKKLNQIIDDLNCTLKQKTGE